MSIKKVLEGLKIMKIDLSEPLRCVQCDCKVSDKEINEMPISQDYAVCKTCAFSCLFGVKNNSVEQ